LFLQYQVLVGAVGDVDAAVADVRRDQWMVLRLFDAAVTDVRAS
jgi:hypothetical protein